MGWLDENKEIRNLVDWPERDLHRGRIPFEVTHQRRGVATCISIHRMHRAYLIIAMMLTWNDIRTWNNIRIWNGIRTWTSIRTRNGLGHGTASRHEEWKYDMIWHHDWIADYKLRLRPLSEKKTKQTNKFMWTILWKIISLLWFMKMFKILRCESYSLYGHLLSPRIAIQLYYYIILYKLR